MAHIRLVSTPTPAHIRLIPTPTPVGVGHGVGTSLAWTVHQILLPGRVWLCKTTVVSQARLSHGT